MKKLTNKTKLIVFLIRWWSVGAVYFFIGWGTRLGAYTSSIDFVIMLGISIGLFNTFIVHTALKMLYDIGPDRQYLETTIAEKISYRLRHVVASIGIVYLVTLIYSIINRTAILLLDKPSEYVLLPGEPIIFGLFYMAIYSLFVSLVNSIKKRSQS